MENLELFNDDFHLVEVVQSLEKEKESIREKVERLFTKEEIELLAIILNK